MCFHHARRKLRELSKATGIDFSGHFAPPIATDGGSKIAFVDALRKAGAECNHTFVVFFYDIFPETAEIMADAGLTLHYLTTWRSVLEAAKEADHLDAATIKAVGDFLDAPREWSAANGGVEA